MPPPAGERPDVLNRFPPDTLRALSTMNRAFARIVIENHRLGLPVIQYLNGEMVETPAESLLPPARRLLETYGEPLPAQVGG